MAEPYQPFDPNNEDDQLGEIAHKAVTIQLMALIEPGKTDSEAMYAVLCGALAGVASFALMIANPDRHREMQAQVQSLIPWAFDQAAGMAETPKLDG